MPKEIHIKDQVIGLGEEKSLDFTIARLPTGTDIDMPIIVGRAKEDGPVLLLLGGMHGDEINGVEILRRFIRKKYHIPDKGSVICIPVLNIFGFINFSRENSDGKDVNRSFPGTASGSLASQVAYFISQEIVPQIDYGVDFHTGGRRINNFPQIRSFLSDLNNEELVKAFKAPFSINASYRDKSLRKYAASQGKSIMVYEAGESLRLRKHAIEVGINGTRRLMKHLGMIDEAPEPKLPSLTMARTTWVRAKRAGMHFSIVRNGSYVEKNEVLGIISDPFGQLEVKIKSPIDGYIIAINNNPVVNRGDALIHIGITE